MDLRSRPQRASTATEPLWTPPNLHQQSCSEGSTQAESSFLWLDARVCAEPGFSLDKRPHAMVSPPLLFQLQTYLDGCFFASLKQFSLEEFLGEAVG